MVKSKKELIKEIEELKKEYIDLHKKYIKQSWELNALYNIIKLNSDLGNREIEILVDVMNFVESIGIDPWNIYIEEEYKINYFFINLLMEIVDKAIDKLKYEIESMENECMKEKLLEVLDKVKEYEIDYIYNNLDVRFDLDKNKWDSSEYWEGWIKDIIDEYNIEEDCEDYWGDEKD